MKPPFLREGHAAARPTSPWLAPFIAMLFFILGSLVSVILARPLLDRWHPTNSPSENGSLNTYANFAALDATGQRAQSRLPLVIDALNEAEDPRVWSWVMKN